MPDNRPLTKADFDAGIQALMDYIRDYMDERISQFARAQRADTVFAELDRISATRNTNPSGYTEKDVERLVDQTREEMETDRKPKREAARNDHRS